MAERHPSCSPRGGTRAFFGMKSGPTICPRAWAGRNVRALSSSWPAGCWVIIRIVGDDLRSQHSRQVETIAGSPAIWPSAGIRQLISSNAIARLANEVAAEISAIRWSNAKGVAGGSAPLPADKSMAQAHRVPDIPVATRMRTFALRRLLDPLLPLVWGAMNGLRSSSPGPTASS